MLVRGYCSAGYPANRLYRQRALDPLRQRRASSLKITCNSIERFPAFVGHFPTATGCSCGLDRRYLFCLPLFSLSKRKENLVRPQILEPRRTFSPRKIVSRNIIVPEYPEAKNRLSSEGN